MSGQALAPSTENIALAADCVREGGVVVAPSDTNMALAVSPRHSATIDRVYTIKNRPTQKPLYGSTEALIDIHRGLAEANAINRSVDPYNTVRPGSSGLASLRPPR